MEIDNLPKVTRDLEDLVGDLKRMKDFQFHDSEAMWHRIFNEGVRYVGLDQNDRKELIKLIQDVTRGFVLGKVSEYEKRVQVLVSQIQEIVK